jgi:hypothetical protein
LEARVGKLFSRPYLEKTLYRKRADGVAQAPVPQKEKKRQRQKIVSSRPAWAKQ